MAERIIFHIDVNSAFLSWTAAYRSSVLGNGFDLREVASVVADDSKSRRSIILAKSVPAKKYGVRTGEPLGMALEKCPNLVIVEPDYALYVTASRKLITLLREYSPVVEQFSIDEAWVDMTGTTGLFGPPVMAADHLRERIRRELGFTVNIGIGPNKLLAKMAGDFEKPDKTHTLFFHEIPQKLWPLPVRELFMVGEATERKLALMGIRTVGALAQTDPAFLRRKLGKQGEILWQFANGRDAQMVRSQAEPNKGYGNAYTTPRDVTELAYGQQVLLSLCETVGMRMRRDGQAGACICVHLRTSSFEDWSHRRTLSGCTNVTAELYRNACLVFEEMWDKKTPLRQLGVQVTRLSGTDFRQYSLFDAGDYDRLEKLDTAVDAIREKFGESAIVRATFLTGETEPMVGGLNKERRTGITKPL